MASKTFQCPNEDCDFSEAAGRAPHYNPCPSCRQPVGFLVETKAAKKKGK